MSEAAARALSGLAPPHQTFAVGRSTAPTALTRPSELAAAVAAVRPYGAQWVAWARYAGDVDSAPRLADCVMIEVSDTPEARQAAERHQLRGIAYTATAEWLTPPLCRACKGTGNRRRKAGERIDTCERCGGEGRADMAWRQRAHLSGVPRSTWQGSRQRLYAGMLETLDAWDKALLRQVRKQLFTGMPEKPRPSGRGGIGRRA